MASVFGLVPAVAISSPVNAAPRDFLTIADAGNYAGNDITFTLIYTGSTAATFGIYTDGGAPGVDYGVTTSGYDNDNDPLTGINIDFPAASASAPATATVAVQTFAGVPPDKTFLLHADPAFGNDVTATGTIWTTPTPWPTYTFLTQSPVPESQSTVTVTATLSDVSPHDVTIPVQTNNSSNPSQSQATSAGGVNRDFTALAPNAAIVIDAGQLSGSIDVSLWDDNVDEPTTQYFAVTSTGTDVGGATAVGGIQSVDIGIIDNDAAPSVSIGNALPAAEGSNLVFPVTLSSLSESDVTVDFTTTNGTDTASTHGAIGSVGLTPNDYETTAVTVTIPAYNRSRNQLVQTTGPDGILEGTETLKATLSTPSGATLGTPATATGTILDADTGPALTLDTGYGSGTEFAEGTGPEVEQTIAVTSAPFTAAEVPLQINYSFVDGLAVNGVDYRGASGTITVPAGSTQVDATIPVTMIRDRIRELPPETFDVVLTSPNGTIDPASLGVHTFTILDDPADDIYSTWTTGDVSVAEGDSGTTMARVPIRLSGPTGTDTIFTATLALGGSATETGVNSGLTVGNDDFDLPTVRTVTIPAGASAGYLDIPINSDMIYERDEAFILDFVNTNGNIDSTQTIDVFHSARVTITNDDARPSVSFNALTASEGSTIRVIGTTTGLSQYPYDLDLTFGPTGQNPAILGTDYEVPTTTPFTVGRGVQGVFTLPIVEVYLAADDVSEGVETFAATATESSLSLIGVGTTSGIYKIFDPEIPTGPVDPTDPTEPPVIPAPSIVVQATRIGIGTVKIAGTTTTQGSVVELWGGSWTTPAIEKIDEVVAGPGGDYTFDKTIAIGWRFAVRANTKWSTVKYVRIIQVPALGASSSGLKGQITLAVQGNPKATGQSVIVQRWTNVGKWITAAKGTTGTDSRWSAVLKPIPSGSSWTFRAFVVTDTGTGTLGGYSVTKMVIVK